MIVLWDLGNVVVRWDPKKILETIGFNGEDTAFIRDQLLGHPDWLDIDRGVKTEATVAGRLKAQSSLSSDQIARCFSVVRESLVDIDRSVELIREVHAAGIPMYVLSNMGEANYAYLRTRDYFKLFDGVVISAEEKLIKPDAALFKLVAKRYQLPVAETLFIDDSLANIETARQLGFQTHHFFQTNACYTSIRETLGLQSG